ncbi:hypothetical protein OAQ99_00840 [Candidatus Kapabacteria bacterium]|nr:hypothetical protein [Candidatus Kapabacteria bacterium]
MRKILGIVIISIALFACNKFDTDLTDVKSDNNNEQVQSRISIGDQYFYTANNIDYIINFIDVTGDSRCPTGVDCFWQGEAIIKLLVSDSNGNSEETLLSTEDLEKEILSLKMTIKELSPYPVYKKEINKSDYVLELEVK